VEGKSAQVTETQGKADVGHVAGEVYAAAVHVCLSKVGGASSGRGHHGARRCTREGSQVGLSGAQSHKTWNGQWPGVTASYGQRCMVPCEVTSMCQNTLAMQPRAGGMPLECGGGSQASRILVTGA
jgi:hypothetical protein